MTEYSDDNNNEIYRKVDKGPSKTENWTEMRNIVVSCSDKENYKPFMP